MQLNLPKDTEKLRQNCSEEIADYENQICGVISNSKISFAKKSLKQFNQLYIHVIDLSEIVFPLFLRNQEKVIRIKS